MITWLIWTIWNPMSSVPKKADKLNLSLSLSLTCLAPIHNQNQCWLIVNSSKTMHLKMLSVKCLPLCSGLNSSPPRQNGRHFAKDNFRCVFFNEDVWILISLNLVPRGSIDNIPALVQIMAWRRPGGKPLSGTMMVSLLTHVWVTRPQCVNSSPPGQNGRHFAEDIFRCIFCNENVWILIKILLNFVPKGSINNIPVLVQIMSWRRTGDKPLSEPMLTRFTDAYMWH